MSLLWTHLIEVAFALTATSSPTPVNCVKTTLRACAASAPAKSGWRGLRCEKPIRWIPQAPRKDTCVAIATARATEPMLSCYCPGTRRPPTKSPSPATAGAMHGSAVNKVTDKKIVLNMSASGRAKSPKKGWHSKKLTDFVMMLERNQDHFCNSAMVQASPED